MTDYQTQLLEAIQKDLSFLAKAVKVWLVLVGTGVALWIVMMLAVLA